jgi:hypothetical protein
MHPEHCRQLVELQLEEALAEEGLFNERVELVEGDYPSLFIRFLNRDSVPRLIHFDCTDYDTQPIAIEPVDPKTRQPLPESAWLRRDGGAFPPHPLIKGPFLCLAGTRHYYTHPSHTPRTTNQRWEELRLEFKLADLIQSLATRFASGVWR